MLQYWVSGLATGSSGSRASRLIVEGFAGALSVGPYAFMVRALQNHLGGTTEFLFWGV